MKHPCRIHITGASGTGTTTLGRALSTLLSVTCFDSDNYFWEPTDPPYSQARDKVERVRLLSHDLTANDNFVLSGSVSGWGDAVAKMFDIVVFLRLPTELRLGRLRIRELEQFGAERLGPGGDMHETSKAFMKWAAGYDSGEMEMRSLAQHEDWLSKLSCPVLRIENDLTTEQRLKIVEDFLRTEIHRQNKIG